MSLMIIVIILGMGSVYSQKSLLGREVTVGGESRFGTPYFQVFGARLGEKDFSAWMQLDITDKKSGVVVSAYHLGDFNFQTPTNFWGLNVKYSTAREDEEEEGLSALVLLEYFYFDNFPNKQGVNPLLMLNYKGWVNVSLAGCYAYFPKQEKNKHQQTARVEISKEVFTGVSFRVAGWYDNLYQNHFFWAPGVTIDLTGGYAFKFDGLFKFNDETKKKFSPIFRVVKNF